MSRQFVNVEDAETVLVEKLLGSTERDVREMFMVNRVKLSALEDRKSTRLNSSHSQISYAVFCLKKTKEQIRQYQQQSEDAFARDNYGLGYDGTDLHYADLIRDLDSAHPFALTTRELVQQTAHQS